MNTLDTTNDNTSTTYDDLTVDMDYDEIPEVDVDSEQEKSSSERLKELWSDYYDELEEGDVYTTIGVDDTPLSKEWVEKFIKSESFTAFAAAFASVIVIISIFSFLYNIYISIVKFMIAKRMGRGTGFAIASIFFWPIMGGVLAFSKNEALEKPATTTPTGTTPNPTETGKD